MYRRLGAWLIEASEGNGELDAPLFADDFDEHAHGEDPDGWTDRTKPGFKAQLGIGYTVAHTLDGDRALFVEVDGSRVTSHIDEPGSSAWQNYEVTGRMMVPRLREHHGVLLYSQMPSKGRAIALTRRGRSGRYGIEVLELATRRGKCTGHPSTDVRAEANKWDRFRVRAMTEGSSVRVLARVWRDGEAEPTVWQADCVTTASQAPTSGTVGVWSGRSGPKYWDDIEVREVRAP